MDGQMTIDDFLCEEKPFSWDSGINRIYDELNQLAERFNLATRKAKWSVWEHVPQYGYRMSYCFVVGKSMENQKDFIDALNRICEEAKKRKIELSPMWGAVWWDNDGIGELTVFSTFLDSRKNRRNEDV